MGCDIYIIVQKRTDNAWADMPEISVFDWRSYGMFGFLANVRNYSAVTPIAEQRGLPADFGSAEDYDVGDHSFSWLSVQELANFDYDQSMEDRRVMRENNGGCTASPGEGVSMSYREFLGPAFFSDLEKLKTSGAYRIVFGFDS